MKQIDHPNIVKFIGVYIGKDQYDLSLVLEYLHTDLKEHLISNPELPFYSKISLLCDISCGLVYLHDKCLIVHGNLTVFNIFVALSDVAKIGGFDSSSKIDDFARGGLSDTQQIWNGPQEIFSIKKSFDIFHMGVLVICVATQEFPNLLEKPMHKLLDKIKMNYPSLSNLVLLCLSEDQARRPSTISVYISLSELKTDNSDIIC